MVKKYVRVWYLMTINEMASLFHTKFGASLFILGKTLRFAFFLILLVRVVGRTQVLGGYTLPQVVVFFLTFNIVDLISQMFFRGVYRFRPLVVRGDFDLILTKPISPLFRSIFSNTDLLDFSVLIPLLGGTAWYLIKMGIVINLSNLFWFVILVINGLLISFSLHVLVVSLAILTTEVDSTIMLYRDLTSMARVPIDVYREPFRTLITFVVPVGVMMAFPAKALLGLLQGSLILWTVGLAVLLLVAALRIWQGALKRYVSASS